MSLRVCAEPGCPNVQPETRCTQHTRAKDRARGTRQQRGYDAEYDRRRRADLAAFARGDLLKCWRCGYALLLQDYSLGHCDDDRSVIHGPEHLRRCNLANTRGGCPHVSHNR